MKSPLYALNLFLCLVISSGALAGGRTFCLIRALNALDRPKVDSSVELELDMSPEVLQLLTTSNGKIGGILQKGEKLPSWLRDWARQKYPKVQAKILDWDKLDPEMKMKLIRDLSKSRNQFFFDDRRLHGIVPRHKVWVNFERPTEFMGKTYPRGKHLLITGKLLGKVEYLGPDQVIDGSGVELHFRTSKTSGQVSNGAWTLLDGLDIPRNHQHVHIVAPLPLEAMRAEPILYPAIMGDFFRRSNLAAEMVDIIHDNGTIKPNIVGEIIYFDSLAPMDLKGVTRYFGDVAKGENPIIGDQFKMGWVGMRGSDKYDVPGLWGIEYRAIADWSDPATMKNVLDSLQYKMIQNSYGLPKEKMQGWITKQSKRRGEEIDVSTLIADSWYNQSWDLIFEKAPHKLKSKLGAERKKKLRETEERELKMLVFNWANDPLLFDSPISNAKIVSEQGKALDRYFKGININDVLSDFLVNSGLYKLVMESVGVEVKTKLKTRR